MKTTKMNTKKGYKPNKDELLFIAFWRQYKLSKETGGNVSEVEHIARAIEAVIPMDVLTASIR
jgi:hypothetical protein